MSILALRRLAIFVGIAGLLAALAASVQAQVPQASTVAVALRALPRGTVLQIADVGGEAFESVLGYETQRVIAAGEALRAPAIAPAAIIHAGDSVSVRVELGGVSASRRGLAMGTARPGQTVRVRVGQHSLAGMATAPGVVLLP